MLVNCPHGSPSPQLYGPSGGICRERLAKAAVKARDSDNEGLTSSPSSDPEDSDEGEESDELGMCLSHSNLLNLSNPFYSSL